MQTLTDLFFHDLFHSLYVVYLNSEDATCLSCKCVSSILHLCVKQRGGGDRGRERKKERKRDMACRKEKSRRREPVQVG